MSKEEQVLSLIKETAEMRGIIDRISESQRFERMLGKPNDLLYILLGVPGDRLDQVMEIARNAIPKLKTALLELSVEEAKEVMQMALANEDYNNTIARVLHDKDTLMSEKLVLQKLIFPDEADKAVGSMLQNWIDSANAPEKRLRGMIRDAEFESKDFKKFREEMDKTLLFYIPLKGLYEERVVSDKVVGIALDAFHHRKAEHMEKLSEALADVITQVDNLDTLEKVARIWREVLPDSLNTKLTKMYLGASSAKVKENIKNIIILMGKDPLQLIQGEDVIMTGGKKIEVKNNIGGFITIDGAAFFKDITHIIHTSPGLNQSTKDELEKLIERLTQELAQIPKEKGEEAQAITELTKDLVDKATKENPNKSLVKITADGLLKAAENIEKIAPKVITIAKQIVALLLI